MNRSMERTDAAPDLVITVAQEDEGRRLDLFLAGRSADVSRSRFKKMIEDGLALVNGSVVKVRYEVRAGDVVTARMPAFVEGDPLVPQEMPLEILYEDEEILVVNKAPGVVVHPGAGHGEGTLVHGLLARCPKLASQGAPLRPGIVHRLDKDTSGALVVAKTERAYLSLIRRFKGREIEKEYEALIYGRFRDASGEIRTLIGRHPTDRKKMAVLESRGREAVSRWRTVRDWGEVSLARVVIETGRTHQIRVHLSHSGHPVVGDETYGGGKHRARSIKSAPLRTLLLTVTRQMLHARRLAFRHPLTDERLDFVAPLPQDFGELLRRLDAVRAGS